LTARLPDWILPRGLARKLRIQYPGTVYHVMNRGDRREPIFHNKADRQRFIETLCEARGKTGWQACLPAGRFRRIASCRIIFTWWSKRPSRTSSPA